MKKLLARMKTALTPRPTTTLSAVEPSASNTVIQVGGTLTMPVRYGDTPDAFLLVDDARILPTDDIELRLERQ